MNMPYIPTFDERMPFRHFFNREQRRPKPPVSRAKLEQLRMLGYMNLDEDGDDRPPKKTKK
jgi:hypothetical protein